MRTLLGDLGAGLLFFAVLLITDDIYKATTAGIILGVIQAAWSWFRTRKIEPMQWLGSGLVLIMGGATILFHDPRFVMFKPSIFFAYHGLVMLKPDWMYRYLPAPNPARPRPANTVAALRRFISVAGVVYAAATLGMAVLNTLIAIYASQKGWALFNAVAPAAVYSVLGTALMIGSRLILRGSATIPTPASGLERRGIH